MESNSFRGKHPLANHSHQTEFDELVEQQDQELAQNGEVSPFTQMQLHALAQGQPIPHVDLNSPAIQAATARLHASFRRYRQSSTNPSVPVEDDLWSGDGYDLE